MMINWSSYQLSRFNVSTLDREGNILLTNTISNILVKIINNPSLPISPFQVSKEFFSYMNDTTLTEMIKYGVIVENAKNENSAIDEIFKNTVEFNKRLDIVILTTNQCNFSCVYCFQKREAHFLNFNQYDGLYALA